MIVNIGSTSLALQRESLPALVRAHQCWQGLYLEGQNPCLRSPDRNTTSLNVTVCYFTYINVKVQVAEPVLANTNLAVTQPF